MTQLVTATYSDLSVAQSAIGSVKTFGFTDDDIVQFTPSEDLTTALYKAGLSRDDAGITAAALGGSGVLVGVRAPFGHATRVAKVLQSYQGGRVNVQLLEDRGAIPADPLSSAFKWGTLLSDPTPFSNFWRLPALAGAGTISSKFGWAQLSGEAAPFSKFLNCKTLTDGPFWVSQVLGPLLISREGEWWR
jgi:hypothetical protein